MGGHWSVDILETERGWYVTDMALAPRSWHWPHCKALDKWVKKTVRTGTKCLLCGERIESWRAHWENGHNKPPTLVAYPCFHEAWKMEKLLHAKMGGLKEAGI